MPDPEPDFVFADSLYMYGPQPRPLTEDMPLTSFGKKPRVRAEITRLWQEARHVCAVAVRAALAATLIGIRPRIQVLPAALAPLISLFRREVRELAELRFQWDRPYLVDASKFAARFWSDVTPFERGLTETIAWYRDHLN